MHFQLADADPDPMCAARPASDTSAPQACRNRLTRLQTAFVDALLLSPTLDPAAAHMEATRRVRKKPAALPYHAGRQLLAYPPVQEELKRRRKAIEASVDAQVIQLEIRLARIAFADIRALFDPLTGALLAPNALDEDIAHAVAAIEEEYFVRGRGVNQESGIRRKYRLIDKLAAIKALMERRGLVGADQSQCGVIANVVINI